jgi:hypothetical protein
VTDFTPGTFSAAALAASPFALVEDRARQFNGAIGDVDVDEAVSAPGQLIEFGENHGLDFLVIGRYRIVRQDIQKRAQKVGAGDNPDELAVGFDRQAFDMLRSTASETDACDEIVITPDDMTSPTFLPWARTYSCATLPGLARNPDGHERRRSVCNSPRRRKSLSLTIPAKVPLISTTGRPLIWLSSISFAASAIEAEEFIAMTGEATRA